MISPDETAAVSNSRAQSSPAVSSFSLDARMRPTSVDVNAANAISGRLANWAEQRFSLAYRLGARATCETAAGEEPRLLLGRAEGVAESTGEGEATRAAGVSLPNAQVEVRGGAPSATAPPATIRRKAARELEARPRGPHFSEGGASGALASRLGLEDRRAVNGQRSVEQVAGAAGASDIANAQAHGDKTQIAIGKTRSLSEALAVNVVAGGRGGVEEGCNGPLPLVRIDATWAAKGSTQVAPDSEPGRLPGPPSPAGGVPSTALASATAAGTIQGTPGIETETATVDGFRAGATSTEKASAHSREAGSEGSAGGQGDEAAPSKTAAEPSTTDSTRSTLGEPEPLLQTLGVSVGTTPANAMERGATEQGTSAPLPLAQNDAPLSGDGTGKYSWATEPDGPRRAHAPTVAADSRLFSPSNPLDTVQRKTWGAAEREPVDALHASPASGEKSSSELTQAWKGRGSGVGSGETSSPLEGASEGAMGDSSRTSVAGARRLLQTVSVRIATTPPAVGEQPPSAILPLVQRGASMWGSGRAEYSSPSTPDSRRSADAVAGTVAPAWLLTSASPGTVRRGTASGAEAAPMDAVCEMAAHTENASPDLTFGGTEMMSATSSCEADASPATRSEPSTSDRTRTMATEAQALLEPVSAAVGPTVASAIDQGSTARLPLVQTEVAGCEKGSRDSLCASPHGGDATEVRPLLGVAPSVVGATAAGAIEECSPARLPLVQADVAGSGNVAREYSSGTAASASLSRSASPGTIQRSALSAGEAAPLDGLHAGADDNDGAATELALAGSPLPDHHNRTAPSALLRAIEPLSNTPADPPGLVWRVPAQTTGYVFRGESAGLSSSGDGLPGASSSELGPSAPRAAATSASMQSEPGLTATASPPKNRGGQEMRQITERVARTLARQLEVERERRGGRLRAR